MAALTVSNYLGMLRDNPDDAEAFEGLKEALASGDAARASGASWRSGSRTSRCSGAHDFSVLGRCDSACLPNAFA